MDNLNVEYTLPLKPELPHYRVAAGMVFRNAHILITQRLPRSFMGGLWEFPGGKQEAEETLEQCLIREVREELDIQISVGALLDMAEHSYTQFRITLYLFHCQFLSGEPKRRGVADFRWILPADLPDYSFPPADVKILTALRKSPHLLSDQN
jgi:A/G-specific adenine glycosylase